jgi:hypothetical protein
MEVRTLLARGMHMQVPHTPGAHLSHQSLTTCKESMASSTQESAPCCEDKRVTEWLSDQCWHNTWAEAISPFRKPNRDLGLFQLLAVLRG